MQITATFGAMRTAIRNRRSEQQQRRRLAEELAAFVTPAERAELDMMLGRHTLEETREIREILNGQEVARQHSAHNIGHYRGR